MFGFEASVTLSNHSYDKDAVQAVLIRAKLLLYRSRGLTLADGIEEIYKNTDTSQKNYLSNT